MSQYTDELYPTRKVERADAIERGKHIFKKLKSIQFKKLPKFTKV